MTSSFLPPSVTQIGAINIATYFKDDGSLGVIFDVDGMSREEAIGRLTVILDRLREEIKFEWGTCPGCGLPWDDHDESEDEEE